MKIRNVLTESDANDQVLFEEIEDLITYIERMYHNSKDKNTTTAMGCKKKACLYLAYAMALRDADKANKHLDIDVIPPQHFFQPGTKSGMDVLKKFAKMTEKDRDINKKVKDHFNTIYTSPEGPRLFDHQINKLRKYFTKRRSEVLGD